MNLHHGRIVDATVGDVLTEGDRIELQVEFDNDRTARIALWQVVE